MFSKAEALVQLQEQTSTRPGTSSNGVDLLQTGGRRCCDVFFGEDKSSSSEHSELRAVHKSKKGI